MPFSVAGFARYDKFARKPLYTRLGHHSTPLATKLPGRKGVSGGGFVRTLPRYTALSHIAGFCPPFLDPTSRTQNNINITVSNTPALTFATFAPTMPTDIVLSPGGRTLTMVAINSPTVIEGGSTIDLTAVTPSAILFATLTPTVSVDATGDIVINVSAPGIMTFSSLTPTMFNDVGINVSNTATLTFSALSGTQVIPGSLGQQNLTSQDLIAIWDQFTIDKNSTQNFSASDAFRLIIAATIAKSFGFKAQGQPYSSGDEFGYFDLDGIRIRIRCRFVGPNRFTVELFPDLT